MATPAARLFCLHGFIGRGSSWRGVLDRLPTSLEASCPDLLGHGQPAAGAGVASFLGEVDRLARLAGLDRPRPVLVGYSLGARLGLALLARHADLFAGAVLVSARLALEDAAECQVRVADDARLAGRLRRDGLECFIDAWQSLPLFAGQLRLPAKVRAEHRERRLSNTADGLARALEVLGLGQMPDDRSALSSLEIPVRVLVGARDERFAEAAESVTRLLPGASARHIPEAGHDLLMEAPQAVAAAIEEVLRDV